MALILILSIFRVIGAYLTEFPVFPTFISELNSTHGADNWFDRVSPPMLDLKEGVQRTCKWYTDHVFIGGGVSVK
jgi:hypothetical protein